MQSSSDEELKTLGRIHNYSEFCRSYEMVRTAGFKNVNVDIMYGLPGQGLRSFSKTLEGVSALSAEHISCYGLIVEDETPFGKNKENLCLPSEEEEYNMYIEACGRFGSLGYKHYEISNYAKPGFESVHNLKYWNCEPYLGFGVAAHSMYDGKRMCNTSNIKEYIEAEHHHFETQKEITDAEKVLKKFNAQIVDIIEYQLPLDENFTRNLIVIKRK
jgi:oxygen-independent coproporphyrinogen-3 oxidase